MIGFNSIYQPHLYLDDVDICFIYKKMFSVETLQNYPFIKGVLKKKEKQIELQPNKFDEYSFWRIANEYSYDNLFCWSYSYDK